jgi:hypothetical protein
MSEIIKQQAADIQKHVEGIKPEDKLDAARNSVDKAKEKTVEMKNKAKGLKSSREITFETHAALEELRAAVRAKTNAAKEDDVKTELKGLETAIDEAHKELHARDQADDFAPEEEPKDQMGIFKKMVMGSASLIDKAINAWREFREGQGKTPEEKAQPNIIFRAWRKVAGNLIVASRAKDAINAKNPNFTVKNGTQDKEAITELRSQYAALMEAAPNKEQFVKANGDFEDWIEKRADKYANDYTIAADKRAQTTLYAIAFNKKPHIEDLPKK